MRHQFLHQKLHFDLCFQSTETKTLQKNRKMPHLRCFPFALCEETKITVFIVTTKFAKSALRTFAVDLFVSCFATAPTFSQKLFVRKRFSQCFAFAVFGNNATFSDVLGIIAREQFLELSKFCNTVYPLRMSPHPPKSCTRF